MGLLDRIKPYLPSTHTRTLLPQRTQNQSFAGRGYGAAEETDPYSGKPLLKAPLKIPQTYQTPEQTISVVSRQRVATSFDPTKAQPITRDMLKNDRLPSSASQSIRKRLGAAYSEELDHQIALTLSGSNTSKNLKLIPKSKNQKAGTLETKLANRVIKGEISLLDAQLMMAKKKGFRLPESPPTLMQRIRDQVLKSRALMESGTLHTIAELGEDPLNLTDNQNPLKAGWDAFKEAIYSGAQKTAAAMESSKMESTYSQRVGKDLERVAGLAEAFLSPISALFAVAEQIPVVGSLAKVISIPFSVAGEGASYAIGKLIDKIPDSILDDRGKEHIRQGAQEIAALASNFVVGGLAYKASGQGFTGSKVPFLPRSQKNLHPVAQEIVVQNPKIKQEVESLPAKKVDDLVTKYGEQDAKTIIKVAAEKAQNTQPPLPLQERIKTAIKPKVSQSSEPIAEGKVSGIAKSIETKAVEDHLTKGFSHLAEYDPITIKAQAKRASDLLGSDIESARKIIRGEEPLPSDLRGTALITAAEEFIKKHKDSELAYELANSPLVSATSVAAQELRLAAERIPDSATARIQELKASREAKVQNVEVKRQVARKQLKEETNKLNLPKEEISWSKFLSEIQC